MRRSTEGRSGTRPLLLVIMTAYRVTVRYGRRFQRYHTFDVEAPDVAAALASAAERIPDEVLPEADLVELRLRVDPEERGYVGGE